MKSKPCIRPVTKILASPSVTVMGKAGISVLLKLGGAGKALAEYCGTATPPNTLGQSGSKSSSCTGMVNIGGGWCVGL
eukprot:9748097-Ditylum_brightwellii.AAC.1